MGTVGLSFGSPTSGAGFDVSSTVSSIVANLQNVETPWKTQLTTLESQDTVISSLGTLLSTLSTDMSSLTDATGVLAEKEGSSSDTNVLTLTAADSSAVSGTHTVTVTNLAQTSSGYLAEIPSASSTLSGSITLQAGSGTALTLKLNSTDNTLAGLASTINASGAGITASVLTDSSGSRLSLVSGTSGADGNITVSDNSIAASDTTLSASVTAGTNAAGSTSATASTSTLTAITNASDTLTGSITIAVGSGTAQTITISSDNTLSTLATAINNDSLGVTASVVTKSDGSSSLKLVSNVAGTASNLTVSSSIVDPSNSLGYVSAMTGEDANLTIDGVALTSSSNTLTNMIPGVTFQLLAPSATESDGSLEQVQVVIANYNTDVVSTVETLVSDYNSLVSAMNTQDGNDSLGNPEPLFGSPTLTLLQQQLLSGINSQNPNGYLTAITDGTGTTLSGSMTVQVGSGTADTIVIGSGTNTTNTFYTGSGSGYNTLSGLAAAINAASSGTKLASTVTAGSSSATSSATLTSVDNASDMLSGSLSVQVGSGATETIVIGAKPSTGAAADTIYTGSGVNTLSGLASAINADSSLGFTATVTTASDGAVTLSLNSGTSGSAGTLAVTSNIVAAGLGAAANVVTSNGQSTLVLASQTEGSAGGALAVTSAISAKSDTALSASVTDGTVASGSTSATASTAALSTISNASDVLSGSITIQVGNGAAQTITVGTSSNTLSTLATAINNAGAGVTASVVYNSNGAYLSLSSGTSGTAGDLTVTSSLLDTTATNTANLSYTNSSDINSLTSLGISVETDGTLSLDVTSLDSVLNADFSSVAGFFQNANSWGQSFNTMLTDAGTSSTTGILSLASSSNSSIESTLNADISKEDLQISAEKKSLTTELNSANEIMQEIPTELDSINELYSAVTGYNSSSS
jgi:flagellar hook-associated protein 2